MNKHHALLCLARKILKKKGGSSESPSPSVGETRQSYFGKENASPIVARLPLAASQSPIRFRTPGGTSPLDLLAYPPGRDSHRAFRPLRGAHSRRGYKSPHAAPAVDPYRNTRTESTEGERGGQAKEFPDFVWDSCYIMRAELAEGSRTGRGHRTHI